MTDTFTPSYYPPHLVGKVGDFRTEPGGNVSFTHNEAATGGFGPEENRKVISPDQYKQTFDEQYRLANPEVSMRGQYGLPSIPKSRSREFQDWLADTVQSGLRWGTGSQAKSVGTSALLSALAGGALGTYLNRDEESPISKGLLYALMAGGLGAGATAMAQHTANARRAAMLKSASYSDDVILGAIMNDNSLSMAQKQACLRALASASGSDRAQLGALLRGVVGSAAGALIMKFLGAKGLLPMAAGGIMGALIGAGLPFASGNKYNSLGQLSI